jgi:transcriptional regulator NrdR family protein
MNRPLTLQEKIELKKLALLKKQGKKEEYHEYLN